MEPKPQIPDDSWLVTILECAEDTWANGTLIVQTDSSGVRSMTYNDLPTTDNNYDADDVRWNVELLKDDTPCTVRFFKGRVSEDQKSIAEGKARSKCFHKVVDDREVEDAWSATSTGTEKHGKKK